MNDLTQILSQLKFDSNGLIPTIVQSADTGRVLMLAWMNQESLTLTVEKGETIFWSRSRQEIWHKGATSGNTQKLVKLQADCDGDTLLAIVHEAGPACHNGTESCFDTLEIL
jgi:phosphoribosyl-AMP cyclohydrolase